jgi:hypothetical protein
VSTSEVDDYVFPIDRRAALFDRLADALDAAGLDPHTGLGTR